MVYYAIETTCFGLYWPSSGFYNIEVLKRERFNTIARPGLKVYAAPRGIPPSPHRREDFSLFTIFIQVYK